MSRRSVDLRLLLFLLVLLVGCTEPKDYEPDEVCPAANTTVARIVSLDDAQRVVDDPRVSKRGLFVKVLDDGHIFVRYTCKRSAND